MQSIYVYILIKKFASLVSVFFFPLIFWEFGTSLDW